MLRLIVKNFGVLKDIDIELHETNLFIGDNGSGKSTLAKLITVVTDFTLNKDEIFKKLKDFDIDFINKKTFIQLQEENELILKIDTLNIIFSSSTKELLQAQEKHKTLSKINNKINEIESKGLLDKAIKIMTEDDTSEAKTVKSLIEDQELRTTLNNLSNTITSLKTKYIPAERNLISIFNQSLSNIISAEIPLPKTLLEFSASYNSARNEIKTLDILGMEYKNENSQDRIYYSSGRSLALENSSSGIQSVLPLYITLKYFATKYLDIIIEEPELNLYPKSQIETVKFMIENRGESSLSIMTHSPYILSTLNMLIFAYKASNTNNTLKEKISAIIPQEQQIDPDNFSAYLIKNGISKNIKGESTGMIQENTIDNIGDRLDNEFNELLDIYSEFEK